MDSKLSAKYLVLQRLGLRGPDFAGLYKGWQNMMVNFVVKHQENDKLYLVQLLRSTVHSLGAMP